jgi:hypothetical protein
MPGRDTRLTETIKIPVRCTGWARMNAGSIAKTARGGTHIDIKGRGQNEQVGGVWMATVVISSWRSDGIGYAKAKLMEGGGVVKAKPKPKPKVEKKSVGFAALQDSEDEDEDDKAKLASDEAKLASDEAAKKLYRLKTDELSDADKAMAGGWGKGGGGTKKQRKKKPTTTTITMVGGGIPVARANDNKRMVAIAKEYATNQAKYDAMAAARLTDGSWRPKDKSQKPDGLASCLFAWKDQGGVRYGPLKYFVQRHGVKSFLVSRTSTVVAVAQPILVVDGFPTLNGNSPGTKKPSTWGPKAVVIEVESTPTSTDSWDGDGMEVLGGAASITHPDPVVKKTIQRINTAGQMDDDEFECDDWETQWDEMQAAQTA